MDQEDKKCGDNNPHSFDDHIDEKMILKMGKLLAISLITTMAAAALFQPILMGKPREQKPTT